MTIFMHSDMDSLREMVRYRGSNIDDLADYIVTGENDNAFDNYDRSSIFIANKENGLFFKDKSAYDTYVTEHPEYKRITFLPPATFWRVVRDDQAYEYTKEFVIEHQDDFKIDWENLVFKYKPITEEQKRLNYKKARIAESIMSVHEELELIRGVMQVLLANENISTAQLNSETIAQSTSIIQSYLAKVAEINRLLQIAENRQAEKENGNQH